MAIGVTPRRVEGSAISESFSTLENFEAILADQTLESSYRFGLAILPVVSRVTIIACGGQLGPSL